MAKYSLLKKEGNARRGTFETVHGTVQTPAFMNVATAAAIKGGLSTEDLEHIGCQVMLCNTYHLHVRPEVTDKMNTVITERLYAYHSLGRL